jgi:N-methylhydantoinase A
MSADDTRAGYRIGVDIGGTFTDLVMVEVATGRLFNEKVLTTPQDPSLAVLAGIELILGNNKVRPQQVTNVIHGTTLVANALIERKGVPTALVTTQGFRDVLEIGREWRYDIYDLFLTPVEPLVPRSLRFEVNERIGHDGGVIEPIDMAALGRVADRIAACGVAAVAVCFLHSFKRADHELQAKALLEARLPQLTVCVSSEVMPEIGEYERTATTVCNAYVQPLFRRYISGLMDGLKRLGIHRDLYLMQSDGGTVHYSTAMEYPIRLVQSGPAGGVQATSLIGRLAHEKDILCFDMGGTTAKACLIENGEPTVTTDFEVARLQRFRKGSGIPLKVPAVDMIEIGSGGGSISRVNRMGLIQVGPDSSSAVPGPACYGQGGEDPTVTDADLILGYLDPDAFLGGDMKLDRAAAVAALKARICEPLGLSVTEAAFGIHETVNETMAQAASIHALEKGRKASAYVLVPIGGAGPVHACHVAQKLDIRRVIIPLGAGVASAFGFLAAPMSFQFVQASVCALDGLDSAGARVLIESLELKGRQLLRHSGIDQSLCSVRVSAAMRYVGQGYEVEVPVGAVDPVDSLAQRLADGFDQCYAALYGRTEKDTPAEVVSWRVAVQGPTPDLTPAVSAAAVAEGTERERAAHALKGRRGAYSLAQGDFADTPIYDRYRLRPGARLDGPAIIEERESTVVVPDGASVTVDAFHNLTIDLPVKTP